MRLISCHAGRWDSESTAGVPQLKGARQFSFEEIKKCTANFSQVNEIGTGGYGKVLFFLQLF